MKKNNKKNIVITGVGGEVGLNLLRFIDKKKYNIIGIDKNNCSIALAKRLFPGIKFIIADLSKKGIWEKYFKNADVIIQLQAQISSKTKKEYIANNIESVRNVVDVCRKYKVKHLIHVSSSVVISVAKDLYTETKKEGENIVKRSKVKYTILRPTLMYGCFDIKHLGYISSFFRYHILPIPGRGKFIRQPLFVEDFCKIIISAIDKGPENKIYNISGKEKIYFIDLLRIFAKEKRQKVIFIPLPIPLFLFLLRIYSIFRKSPYVKQQLYALMAGDIFPVINWEKIFGVRYTPFKKGIKKTIASKYFQYGKELIKCNNKIHKIYK